MSDSTTPLLQHNYTFVLSKLEDTTLNLQSISLPTVSLSQKFMPTRSLDITLPGDKLAFDSLPMEFIVDENMNNYTEIMDWMWEGSNPKTGNKYKKVSEYATDGVLTIYGARGNIVKRFRFQDCYPISLGGVSFINTSGESVPVTASLVLSFSLFFEDGLY